MYHALALPMWRSFHVDWTVVDLDAKDSSTLAPGYSTLLYPHPHPPTAAEHGIGNRFSSSIPPTIAIVPPRRYPEPRDTVALAWER